MKKISFLIISLFLTVCVYSQDIILSHTNGNIDDITGSICNLSDIDFALERTLNAASYSNKWIKSKAYLERDGAKIQKNDQFSPAQLFLTFSKPERKEGNYKAIIKHKFLGITIKKEESNEINVSYTGSKGSYNPQKTTGRLITGNFNNSNGDDVSAMYDYYGNNKPAFHMWLNDSYNRFTYQGNNGWLKFGSYNPLKVSNRVVTGDFDNDGKEDDVATLYDYGNNKSTFHVFLSDGSKFYSQGSNGFLVLNSYNANKVTGRMVSGDFDNDGYKDDIATLYDYGNNKSTFHVFLSDGSKFISQGTNGFLVLNSYNANKVTGRMVSGDFDNDGYKDDIATLYDYGNNKSTFHVFLSDGSKFISQGTNGWLALNSYNANKVTYRMVSGDFDNNQKDDIATLYDYGNNKSTLHVFLSDGSKFNSQGTNGWLVLNSYDAGKVTGIGTGRFDLNGRTDIIMMYDYGCNQTRIHTFLSGNNNKFLIPHSLGWWQACNDDCN